MVPLLIRRDFNHVEKLIKQNIVYHLVHNYLDT